MLFRLFSKKKISDIICYSIKNNIGSETFFYFVLTNINSKFKYVH